MQRFMKPSVVVVAIAVVGLVIGLDGPTWASRSASAKIGTSGIKNHAVTAPKIAPGAVKASKIAPNAVGSSQVADGSLTAADVAPNTFVSGPGATLSGEVTAISAKEVRTVFDLGFGEIRATCGISDKPQLQFVAETTPVELVVTSTSSGSGSAVQTANGLTTGGIFPVPGTAPQSVEFQVHATDAQGGDHFATVWMTDQVEAPRCVFFGQGLTTG
jgi:hypothetical protein